MIPTTSRPLYVYLQRPDNARWVTVGRYRADPSRATGEFRYAPSYIDLGLSWSIDPVNVELLASATLGKARAGKAG